MAPNNNLRLLSAPSIDIHNGILVYAQTADIPDGSKLTVRVGERTRTGRFEGGHAWLRFDEPFEHNPFIRPVKLVKPDKPKPVADDAEPS